MRCADVAAQMAAAQLVAHVRRPGMLLDACVCISCVDCWGCRCAILHCCTAAPCIDILTWAASRQSVDAYSGHKSLESMPTRFSRANVLALCACSDAARFGVVAAVGEMLEGCRTCRPHTKSSN